jgi:hypothetical protein
VDEPGDPEPTESAPDPDALWRRPVGPEVRSVDIPHAGSEWIVSSPEVGNTRSAIAPRHRRITPRVAATVGAGVVAVGLFAAWALSRQAAEPTPADAIDIAVSTTVATTVATTTTTPPPVTTVPASEPVTSSTPVATIAARWRSGTTEIDQRVRELGIRIVAVRPGELLLFNTEDGGTASSYMRSDFRQAPYLDAGADWILVRHTDTGQTQLYRGLSEPLQIDAGQTWSTYRQPGTDRFWMSEPLADGSQETALVEVGGALGVLPTPGPPQRLRIAEIDHEGNATGAIVETSSRHTVLGADPVGGIVVAAPGGTYHLGVEGSARITSGNVIALSTATALAVDCADGLSTCGLVVLDRSTGTATALVPVVPDSVATPNSAYAFDSPAAYGFPALYMQISPDDRYAPIVLSGSRPSFGVIDMTTGEYTELSITPQSSLWWSPDSRRVMYLSDRRLLMYEFDTGEAFDVLPDYANLWSFTVRD